MKLVTFKVWPMLGQVWSFKVWTNKYGHTLCMDISLDLSMDHWYGQLITKPDEFSIPEKCLDLKVTLSAMSGWFLDN